MLRNTPKLRFLWISLATLGCGASGDRSPSGRGGEGGRAIGAGGVMASGGQVAAGGGSGGSTVVGSGGSGGSGRGGATGAGGGSGRGGATGEGGANGHGGATGAGGENGRGGMVGSGGAPGTGGARVGGATGTGGVSGSGGATGAGGVRGSGGSGGSGGVGGAQCPDAAWKLLWSDEFDGPAGAAADSAKWAYDFGPNWYNNELQYYSQGTANASLDGSGNLVIEARKENREGRQYTSARLKTEGKKTFTYGRFESRMKLPFGKGMWPAFWLLGGNNWPATGEIDIMEQLGREPSVSHGAMHGPNYSGANGPTASYTLPGGARFSDDFHVFALEWEAEAIRWYVDGALFSTRTKADTGGNPWVFDHPFFIIINLAVGGDWPGNPDATTVFPQKMLVDYVRVCQRQA